MTDPPYQHPQYPPYTPAPPPPGGAATFYAPPESLYQNPPYDYDPQQPYTQHLAPPQPSPSPYASQYDLNQTTPRSAPPPPPPGQQHTPGEGYLHPQSAAGAYHGSSADYYNQYDSSLPPASSPQRTGSVSPRPDASATTTSTTARADDETDRSLGGTLVGGATGYYLGHKRSHGFLGAGVGARTKDGGDIIVTIIITTTMDIITMDIDIIGQGRGIVVIVGGRERGVYEMAVIVVY
ncbi:hypothetical protein BDV59DRAFT_204451 [Aspergillus ambiguus]|uniref:uncharacterized protein n=1 Tax=Aspergillus ambiguus TaxID=176160 RepID=UPI003CCCE844